MRTPVSHERFLERLDTQLSSKPQPYPLLLSQAPILIAEKFGDDLRMGFIYSRMVARVSLSARFLRLTACSKYRLL